jgi:hypothetical protein
MHQFTTTIALAVLLFSGAASAAGGSGKEPGKGAAGPAAAPSDNSPGGGKSDDQTTQLLESRDTRGADTRVTPKTWEVSAGFEYHHILDTEFIDNAANRNVEAYTLSGRWDVTPYDRLSVRWGVFQGFIVDAADSLVRADDISVGYTRRIPLPGKVTLRASFSLAAPISYNSQLSTLILSPRGSLQVDRKFGHFSLDGRIGGTVFLFKYAEGGGFNGTGIAGNGTPGTGVGGNGTGASPNPKGSLTLALGADYSMPFHEQLSVGLSVYNGYGWFYDVNCTPNTMATDSGISSAVGMQVHCPPVTNGNQPQQFLQSFAGEVHVNYALPTFGGFKSDLSATFAPNGDSAIGYAGVTDGTGMNQRLANPGSLFYYRQSAEVFFALTGRY